MSRVAEIQGTVTVTNAGSRLRSALCFGLCLEFLPIAQGCECRYNREQPGTMAFPEVNHFLPRHTNQQKDPMALTGAHLRIARPTDRLEALVAFYTKALGFLELGRFHNHDGFDGVMLGHDSAGYHLEFTHAHGHVVGSAPTQDHLLVFYLPADDDWNAAISRIEAAGCAAVPSFNPYWDRHGRTYEDPDGYRIVIQHAPWNA